MSSSPSKPGLYAYEKPDGSALLVQWSERDGVLVPVTCDLTRTARRVRRRTRRYLGESLDAVMREAARKREEARVRALMEELQAQVSQRRAGGR